MTTSQSHGETIGSRSSTSLATLIPFPEYEMPIWNVKTDIIVYSPVCTVPSGASLHTVTLVVALDGLRMWHLAADLCTGQAWAFITGTATRKRLGGPGFNRRWKQVVFSLPDLWRTTLGPTQPPSKLTAAPAARKVAGAWRRPPPHSNYCRSSDIT